MPRRVSSMGSLSSAGTGGAGGSSGSRGPRPAKTPNCIAPASPSPDSSSDNASDNSDLFQWSTSMDATHLPATIPSASRHSSAAQQPVHGGLTASLTASRKRKLLEQFLLPENATGASGNTISLSEMRTLGLVGQARPSASVQPTNVSSGSMAAASSSSSSSSAAAAAAAAAAATAATRSPVQSSGLSNFTTFVPSFSFYQTRSFGTPSCSGGGSTESLCSSTADSACGHPPDLPDDGNLATPAAPMGHHDVSHIL